MTTTRDEVRAEKLRGGVLGLLVGDALGVPYEFHDASRLPERIEMAPDAGFARAHLGTPPGTYSDDGAQALALLATLVERGGLDVDDFAERLLGWRDRGYLAVDARVFDVGNQTELALDALRDGEAPLEAGPRGERQNGNGSLMRVLPLALFHAGTDAELVRDADLQSRLTHGHPRSRVACALYCLWARRFLEAEAPFADPSEPWRRAVASLREVLRDGDPLRAELEEQIRPDERIEGHGSGYVLDALWSARMLVERFDRYEDAVVAAIRLGDDTDTTACVVGGIAGIREGAGAIPARWLEALRGREHFEPLVAALVELRG